MSSRTRAIMGVSSGEGELDKIPRGKYPAPIIFVKSKPFKGREGRRTKKRTRARIKKAPKKISK